jgi:hypothetical protein
VKYANPAVKNNRNNITTKEPVKTQDGSFDLDAPHDHDDPVEPKSVNKTDIHILEKTI